jgi:hypothetical protein
MELPLGKATTFALTHQLTAAIGDLQSNVALDLSAA